MTSNLKVMVQADLQALPEGAFTTTSAPLLSCRRTITSCHALWASRETELASLPPCSPSLTTDTA